MEIKGKVHCFFEQSGTFKNEFKKLGYDAYDYDIQNNFNETDYIIDLFAEIKKAYDGSISIFGEIGKDDLIMAFFPCILFCGTAQINITLDNYIYKFKTLNGADDYILNRVELRFKFYCLLLKLCFICIKNNIRLIIENPYMTNTYLKGNFIKPPSIIDNDRTKRGDYFVKPTAYWFFNCKPTKNETIQQTPKSNIKHIDIHTNKNHKKENIAKGSSKSGLCSEERSMISPDYARNFICDFILGREQPEIDKQLKLF